MPAGRLITATNQYDDGIRCLFAMLASLKTSNPRQRITVYLYNADSALPAQLESINDQALIVPMQTNYDGQTPRDYMSSVRASLLQREFCESRNNPVAWIDTDVLFRGPLFEFWELLSYPDTIAVTHRPGQRDRAKFASGFCGFSPGAATDHLLAEWHQRTREPYWFCDQLELYRSFLDSIQFGMQLQPLPERIHDIFSWNADSAIWHRRGMHAENPKWIMQMIPHLKNANSAILGIDDQVDFQEGSKAE